MITVLLIAEDTSRFLNRNFYYLEQELKKLVNLLIWRKAGHIHAILKQIPTKPDVIFLLNDMDKRMSPMIKGLAHIDIPTCLFVNDIHRFTELRRNFINKNKIKHIFTIIRDPFIQSYPEFQHKMEWIPHFINSGIYRDYGLNKNIGLLMMGAVNKIYPLREKIKQTYATDPRFVYRHHPGYRDFSLAEEAKNMIGMEYAKEINRAKIFFTCASILNYPVIKYFEALACKTLLLAPTFSELEDLGFIPGYHFIPIDETDFQEKADYYLENEMERQQIAEQGYQFIHQKHTAKVRAEQLVEKIASILHR